MKIKLITAATLFAVCVIHGQGMMFIYDQQSTNEVEGSVGLQSDQPMGQSFTPTFSSVSFVRLKLYDGDFFNHSGGTVLVNLRSNSITGTILGSSLAVFMPHDFFDATNFIFSIPVTVVPGVTYYLQPVAQVGSDGFGSFVTDGSYFGGSLIYQGGAIVGRNLWFQEGIIAVPEPSAAGLALLGGGVWLWVCRRK